MKYKLGADRFVAEEEFYKANPVLGKIPLVVRVRQKNSRGQMVGVEGVTVYMQFIDPDDPLKNDTEREAPRAYNNPPKHAPSPLPDPAEGPLGYMNARREDYEEDEDDVQKFNTHARFGGKRKLSTKGTYDVGGKYNVTLGSGTAVSRDNLFSTESIKGFNVKHGGRDLPVFTVSSRRCSPSSSG